jgi:hypothetical protein
MYEYSTLTELGKLYGVTSHVTGRWLTDIGLRSNKRPSQAAFAGGFVEQAPTGRGGDGGYFWVWETEKTIAALEAAGYRRPDQEEKDPPTNRLIGPFTHRLSGATGCEIVGGDGMVSMWVVGEENARRVTDALNRFFQ